MAEARLPIAARHLGLQKRPFQPIKVIVSVSRPKARATLGLDAEHNSWFVARAGAGLFAAGATLAELSVTLPHGAGVNEAGVTLCAFVAYLAALCLFVFAGRFTVTGIQIANGIAILLVTGLIHFSGEPTSSYVLLYIWAGLYAFYFLPVRRAIVQGILIAVAYALIPFGGHQIWWLLVVGTVFVIGTLVTFLQSRVGRLVSELGEASRETQLLGEIVMCSGDAIISGAPDGTITSWNPGAERLYGYEANEACGRTVNDLIIPTALAGEEKGIINKVLSGERVDNYETQRRHKDGHLLDVSVSASAIRDSKDEVIGISVITHNITERKRRERELLASVESYKWLRRVRSALDEDRFLLYSQPIADARSGQITREELLLRMRGDRSADDVIAPGAFLPVVEEFDMVGEIDRWVIQQSIPLLNDGREIEINLSGRSVGDPSITKLIEVVLDEVGADPSGLTVEITETALVKDMQAARAFAERLERLGCALALDDFGTGYGSFTYLRHLPVQFIKIDVDFIRELLHNPADQKVVRSIIGVAKGFGIKTIAEGIEDDATLRVLIDYGIDFAQGYYIGRPRPLDSAPIRALPRAADPAALSVV
jgi:PAS domain S-box-containing protein